MFVIHLWNVFISRLYLGVDLIKTKNNQNFDHIFHVYSKMKRIFPLRTLKCDYFNAMRAKSMKYGYFAHPKSDHISKC